MEEQPPVKKTRRGGKAWQRKLRRGQNPEAALVASNSDQGTASVVAAEEEQVEICKVKVPKRERDLIISEVPDDEPRDPLVLAEAPYADIEITYSEHSSPEDRQPRSYKQALVRPQQSSSSSSSKQPVAPIAAPRTPAQLTAGTGKRCARFEIWMKLHMSSHRP